MLAVRINNDGYVCGFDLATLKKFQTDPKYATAEWRFVDRSNFWSPAEISKFMLHPSHFYYDDINKQLTYDFSFDT